MTNVVDMTQFKRGKIVKDIMDIKFNEHTPVYVLYGLSKAKMAVIRNDFVAAEQWLNDLRNII